MGEAARRGEPFALTFVDVRMPPGIDGIETIARMWKVDPEIQAVICTAYSDHPWEDMTRVLGQVDRFLVLKKPFDAIEVLQLVHALTRKWNLARTVFTTKADGHGFGLHSSANAAVEMGGGLSAHSNGVGCGATFLLRVPVGARAGAPPREAPPSPGPRRVGERAVLEIDAPALPPVHGAAMTEPLDEDTSDPGLWKKDGWVARVLKNEDDDGWAVEMTRRGDDEPALVTPWTMGRDKKNPKPLDQSAFTTLVKTASEVLIRHEQTARARLHRSFSYTAADGQRIGVDLDVAPDDDDPHAILKAYDERSGEVLRSARVSPTFKLSATSAERFVRSGEA